MVTKGDGKVFTILAIFHMSTSAFSLNYFIHEAT